MSTIQVMSVAGVTNSIVRAAIAAGVLVANPEAAVAKVQFTSADLAAVELDPAQVSGDMQADSFSLSAVLPWFEVVRSQAAAALLEM